MLTPSVNTYLKQKVEWQPVHAAIEDCRVYPLNENTLNVLRVSFKQGYFQSITTTISIILAV